MPTKTTKVPTAKKVTPKKSVAKKAAQKVALTKKRAVKKLPAVTRDEHAFWTTNGVVLKSLDELAVAFGSMDDTVFFYHVNKDKNDFATWVEHVLNDATCASALRKCKTPKSAKLVVMRRLRFYA